LLKLERISHSGVALGVALLTSGPALFGAGVEYIQRWRGDKASWK